MAVRAKDVTFRYLQSDGLRAPAMPDHRTDVRHLVTLVIEVEHDDVGLAAADARVARQVLAHEIGGYRALPRPGPTRVLALTFAVSLVPGSRIVPLAREADPLPRALWPGSIWKVREWANLTTHAAATELS